MFTGIVEEIGKVIAINRTDQNLTFSIQADMTKELKVDQSVSHNGVCLTVESCNPDNSSYTVTAIQETLDKSNLGGLSVGNMVNLERAMIMNARLDGHMVQGHVDGLGECISVKSAGGSWEYRFKHDGDPAHIISKGSVAINGVSLTVVDPTQDEFGVAIIPYTYEHTTFKFLQAGDVVNLEYDIVGKYVLAALAARKLP